jgi:hypothetical protein
MAMISVMHRLVTMKLGCSSFDQYLSLMSLFELGYFHMGHTIVQHLTIGLHSGQHQNNMLNAINAELTTPTPNAHKCHILIPFYYSISSTGGLLV